MKPKKDKYHIQIKTDFLLNSYDQFKSEYTPWVYVFLKLKCNYYMKYTPNSFDEIMPRKKIADFFDVNESTIHHAFKELIANGLLQKQGSKYRLIKEDNLINTYRQQNNIEKAKIVDFIQIHFNDFYKFADALFKERPKPNTQRLVIKALRIYYYLYTQNRHLFKNEIGKFDSSESQSSISRNLKHDPTTVKAALKMLEDAGYIKLESENGISFNISTLNKNTYDAKWDEEKKKKELEHVAVKNTNMREEDNEMNEGYLNVEKLSGNLGSKVTAGQPKVPDNFIGYGKYDLPPYKIFRIYYQNNKQLICQGFVGESDGLQPTDEEMKIQESLLCSGHKSRYFKKENYWLYAKPVTDAKAA
ncbi:MAG: winged helix-turn-helix transcriptional regulator [Ignavibacteria bacterium]|nr:winged helix-turn-helix transcriptional regulator [Ignavibacteria bacterium]